MRPPRLETLWRPLVIVAALSSFTAGIISGQFLSMQASTRDEYDAYLRVLEAAKPSDVVAAVEAFEHQWPHSQLLAHAWELELEALRSLNDAERAIQAAEKVLKLAPNHIGVLVSLASILPNNTRDPARLARAETCANQALDLLQTFHAPRTLELERWESLRAKLRSEAHAALGFVGFKRNDLNKAAAEFETAISLAPAPDPVHYYRLANVYLTQNRLREAKEKFQRAAQMNNPGIRQLAEQALKSLPK